MENRREEERAELYRGIERIANDLRGSVDGWDFKSYVLGFLFYRYISENLTNYINEREIEATGDESFNYEQLEDSDIGEDVVRDIVYTKGFYIKPSELFNNVLQEARNDNNLNLTLATIFENIESTAIGTGSEDNFKGLFDDIDVSSTKLGGTLKERNKRIVDIMEGIGSINFGEYGANSIDAFGDAYEHLMSMYAQNAGRSGGEYFTPQEVSKLLTKITLVGKDKVNKVYDPTCGSGSLLLQSAKILGKDRVLGGFYGQEKNYTTYNLARINMFLHDIGYDKFDIQHGDTLKEFKNEDNEPFDVIVSNPPYSVRWEGEDDPLLLDDERYTPAGVLAPKGKADLAFVMHILYALSQEGTAAVVSFPGVMYRMGREEQIRKYLVDNNFVDAVIELPEDLFYGTSISTVIMVLKKNKTEEKTLFIDASKEFVKVTNSNKLSPENISNILTWYEEREEVDYKARLVENTEISKNNYNLSPSTYVEKEDLSRIINISELNAEISSTVTRIDNLRGQIEDIILEIEGDNHE